MDGCVEPHHPSKSAQTLQTVGKTGRRRTLLSFSHTWRMAFNGHVNRTTHADSRERQQQELEKMLPHLLCQHKALKTPWHQPHRHPSTKPQGMRHLCWIWFSLWAQILLLNLSPIPPEQQGHGVLSDPPLRHLPGRKWGHVRALRTWRRIRFWKTYFSYDSEAHATEFPQEIFEFLSILV